MNDTTAGSESQDELRRWFVEAWRPSHREASYEITDVEGEIPRELSGTLYRNGPSQNVLPKEGDEALHLFDGDGLVHRFRFDDGRARYTGRFVRNASFVVEEEEGRYCMNGLNLQVKNSTDRVPGRVQPNTNIVPHAGRVFTMVENGVPFEIDPATLEPLGEWNLDGRLLGYATSAHPKIDPRTGEMVLHGYQIFPPYLQLYVIGPDGRVSLAEPVEAPYPVMMHDMAITANHVVFPLCPVTIDPDVLVSGGVFADAVRWEPEKGMKFGVGPRSAGGEIRWFEARTPGFLFHFGNAFEEGGKILVDACLYPDPGSLFDSLRTFRSGRVGKGFAAYPFLYELDLRTGECREYQLDDREAEFPRIDDRRTGYRNRYGYAVTSRDDARTPYERALGDLVKYDRERGRSVRHRLGRGQFPSEPIFVPRTPEAEEDDGFVLTVVYDGPTGKSYVAILDAKNFDASPLAKLPLRHRIPMGFHGNFAPES